MTSPLHRVTRTTLVPIALACTLALTGCAVEVLQGAASPASAPKKDAPLPGTETSRSVATSAQYTSPQTSAAQVSPASGDDVPENARRSYYDGKITRTTNCQSGSVVVDKVNSTVLITGPCERVQVTAAYTHVLADHVGTLFLDSMAANSTVLVKNVDSVKIAASFSAVYWDEGNPTVGSMAWGSIAVPNPAKE